MKYIYFGSSYFSEAVLSSLYFKGLSPAVIVSKPDKPKGRGLKLQPTQVSLFAQSKKIRLIKPQSLRDKIVEEELSREKPELFVIADYGKIIPLTLLAIPRILSLCLHPSLLPRYRGPTPIERTLINGDKETGATVFKVNERIDAGEIILQRKIAVDYKDDFFSLRQRLIEENVLALAEAIKKIENKNYNLTAQEESLASWTSKLKKEDGRINWEHSAENIRNLIRALLEWPTAYTYHKDLMIKILETEVVNEKTDAAAGTVINITKQGIDITASEGILRIKKVKPQGKKEMDAFSFTHGYKVKEGDRFV
ncbi:MAG: methionyl-tRNA formyltransferase [Candidatus Omnitrophota bacterium]